MSKLEVWGIIISIVTGVFGVISWVYSRLKDKKEKNEEKNEIQSLKPTCEIRLFPYFKLDESNYNFVVGLPENATKKDHFFLKLPIAIGNSGGSDLEDIKVIFKYSSQSPLAIDNNTIELNILTGLINARRSFEEGGEGKFATFHLDKLPIKVAAELNEVINLFSSYNTLDIPSKSKDGVEFIARVKFTSMFYFEFYVYAKNTEMRKININLLVYPSKSIDDLLGIVTEKINENLNSEKEQKFPDNQLLFYPTFTFHSEVEGIRFYMAELTTENFRKIYLQGNKLFILKYNDSKEPITVLPA